MEQAAEGRTGFERLRALGIAYIAFARAQPAVYLLMFGPELVKDPFPALKAVAERSFEVFRAAVIGAWALVHGLSHLIADHQFPPDFAGEDKLDALIEDVLAIYRQGLARGAEPH